MVDECSHLLVSLCCDYCEGPGLTGDLYRFLISTHYVKYNYLLFGINFAACVFVLFPKLPVVSFLLVANAQAEA